MGGDGWRGMDEWVRGGREGVGRGWRRERMVRQCLEWMRDSGTRGIRGRVGGREDSGREELEGRERKETKRQDDERVSKGGWC